MYRPQILSHDVQKNCLIFLMQDTLATRLYRHNEDIKKISVFYSSEYCNKIYYFYNELYLYQKKYQFYCTI